MDDQELSGLIESIKSGEMSADDAFTTLKRTIGAAGEDSAGFEDLGFAKVDHAREKRNGFPEVIFCEGKSVDHISRISESLLSRGNSLLATRADRAAYEAIVRIAPDAVYHELARIVTIARKPRQFATGLVSVVSAGTADMPVSEEAAVTAEFFGLTVRRFYDVGVAGLHRLLHYLDDIREADVIICVAGMEGALPSVMGGLVDKPVFAVPSGIGYGAGAGGIATLLAMLNCCASGVSVMNIGNGFGAAYMAATICRLIHRQEDSKT